MYRASRIARHVLLYIYAFDAFLSDELSTLKAALLAQKAEVERLTKEEEAATKRREDRFADTIRREAEVLKEGSCCFCPRRNTFRRGL